MRKFLLWSGYAAWLAAAIFLLPELMKQNVTAAPLLALAAVGLAYGLARAARAWARPEAEAVVDMAFWSYLFTLFAAGAGVLRSLGLDGWLERSIAGKSFAAQALILFVEALALVAIVVAATHVLLKFTFSPAELDASALYRKVRSPPIRRLMRRFSGRGGGEDRR